MMFAPLVVPLLLLFAPLLSSKDLPRFVEEEEPELRSRLAQLQLLDHRGPVRSRRSSQLPQYTDVICEAAHGKAGYRVVRFGVGRWLNLGGIGDAIGSASWRMCATI